MKKILSLLLKKNKQFFVRSNLVDCGYHKMNSLACDTEELQGFPGELQGNLPIGRH
jgi:hypothetical protein